jgi:hypothetical protein
VVPDGIHAAVDPVKAPGLDPARDRVRRDTELDKLPGGVDPVLAGGQNRDGALRVGLGDFLSHRDTKSPGA